MSLTNKVLYDIDQRNDTTPTQRETARKNIGAYEDKTTAGGGTGIPKADLASDVQSSLGKADSSVQSVTSNGQTLTKSAAGAIDIPKATDTKWGVVQVVEQLMDNKNVIPNSQVVKQAVDGLKEEVNALKARATFWTEQEWQTQSAQPGDASKIYYVGPKGTGRDQYDMYEWRSSSQSYVLTDESTISLDGYWHGAPDIVGEDTVAPFITSIEKKADDTVKYRTCSATVGDLSLPVFMDSGVVTPVDPHQMFPIVRLTTPYAEVRSLVERGYRPILLPYNDEYGERYQITETKMHYSGPEYIFTAIENERGYLPFFADKKIVAYSCQNVESETWIQLDEHLLPVIPEPNESGLDIGKVLTVSAGGRLYWDEPAGGNNVEVRAGTNNLHVTSADVNDKTIFTMSADYYHSSGNFAGTYTGPGTLIVDPTTMNLESTNSAYGYREQMNETTSSSSNYTWHENTLRKYITSVKYLLIQIFVQGAREAVRSDMSVELTFKSNNTVIGTVTVDSDMLLEMKYNDAKVRIPWDTDTIDITFQSEDIVGDGTGYANAGYILTYYSHSDNKVYGKAELAWKEETYNYVDEGIMSREPRLPVHGSGQKNKVLTVSGNNGELGWMTASGYREGQYIHIDANNVITASGLQPKLATPNSECYLCGTENGGMLWLKRKKYMYKTTLGIRGDGVHTITQTDINNKYCDIPIIWSTETDTYGLLNRADNFLFALTIGDMRLNRGSTNYPLNNIVSKIKCSLCDETQTWFSNDNAHGNDPHGMIFDDILGSELARVPGHPTLDKEVRRVAYGPNNLAHFMGPSFRVMFSDTSTLAVGDKIEMDGIVSGIDFKDGGWGAI